MRSWLLVCMILALTAGLSSCGKSEKDVTITLTPTTATVSLAATQQFTAVVSNADNTNVTWYVNDVQGGNATVGTITTEGLYTAPSNALNSSTVSVKCVSVQDTTVTSTATVTIKSGAKVTVKPVDGVTLSVGESFTFTDTVTNVQDSSTSTAVDWYVNDVKGGSSTTGSITTSGVYTAPSTVSSSTSFVVKAKLQADANSYGSSTVTVVPAGAATLSTVSPSTVAQNSLFEDVYLQGKNFLSTSVVQVGGQAVPTTFLSTTALRARIPAEMLASAEPTLYLEVKQQSGALSEAVRLSVVPSATALISTSPDSVPRSGGTVSVAFNGGYYGKDTSATFNGQDVSSSVTNSRQTNVAVNDTLLGTPGLYPVTVRNSGAASRMSATNLAVRNVYCETGDCTGTQIEKPTILTTQSVGNSPLAVAVDTATGIAVVANSGSNSLTLIGLNPNDSANYLKTIKTVAVGTTPTSVAIDNVLHYAVVTNMGDSSISVVDISDPANPQLKATITSGIDVKPYAVGVNPLTQQALVAYYGSSTVSMIDLNTMAVTATGQIPTTGANPQVAIDTRLNWGIVTPGGSGTVSVVDLGRSARNVVSVIDVPSSNGAVRKDGTVTITTAAAHGLTAGQKVVIAGVDDSSFDGTFTVATAPSTTTFTYSQSGDSTTSGNGTVSAAAPLLTIALNANVRGVSVNTETEEAVLSDPSSSAITFVNLLDQTVRTLSLETGIVATAVNPLTNVAVIANQSGNSVSVLDLREKRRLAQFTVATKPTAVAIDPVTNTAVVVNQSSNTATVVSLGGIRDLHVVQMSPASTMTSTAAQKITLIGNGFGAGCVVRFNETALETTVVNPRMITATIPSSMLASPQTYVVDVKNSGGSISNINHFMVMHAIPVGTAPRGVAIDQKRRVAVVTNSGSDTVSLLDIDNLSTVATLKAGNSPQGVALSSLAGRAVVTNREDDTVTVIDLNNSAVSSTVSVAPESGTSKPTGIAVDPGTGKVVVADGNAAQISIFDIANPGTPKKLAVDVGPAAVAIDPGRGIAAVAETASGEVVLVDLNDDQVLERVSGFQLPTGAMYDPDSDKFLITSSLSNNVGSVTADPATSTYTVSFNRVGINPTSLDYNYRSSTLVTTNTLSQTMSVMDFPNKRVMAILPLSVSQQFGVAIDSMTNRAVVVDQNNNRVLIFQLPR